MRIAPSTSFQAPRALSRKFPPTASSSPQDQVKISSGPPQEPPSPRAGFGQRVVGGITGALIGILAGHAGPGGVALAAGLGSAAVTTAAVGPILKEGLDQGMTGDVINDIAITCGTIAAGGMLLASTSASAAGLGYALAYAIPGASPVLGGLVGASVGAYFGMKN